MFDVYQTLGLSDSRPLEEDFLCLRLLFWICFFSPLFSYVCFKCMHFLYKGILSHKIPLTSVVLRPHCSFAVWEELKCVYVVCVCGKSDHIEERLFINNWLFYSNILDPLTSPCVVFTPVQVNLGGRGGGRGKVVVV